MAKTASTKRALASRHRSKRTSDELTPISVVLKNNGLKAGQAYYMEANRPGMTKRFHKWCGRLGTGFSRHGNGWMVTPITDISPDSVGPQYP